MFLRTSNSDNVAVAMTNHCSGELVDLHEPNGTRELVLESKIDAGHKVAVTDIASGEIIVKNGIKIGVASKAINEATHVHVHNVKSLLL